MAKQNTKNKKFKIGSWLKEPKVKMNFSCSVGIVLLLILILVGFGIGFPLAIVNSTVITKLQHYTCSSRSSDWENPKVVHTTYCILDIELHYEHLAEYDGSQDVMILLFKAPLPVTDTDDWIATGTFIDQVYLSGNEMLPFCSGYDGVQYYTIFAYTWGGLPALEQGFLYFLYIDFYDADDEFWYCPAVSDFMGGDGGFEIIRQRPPINPLGLQILVEDGEVGHASDFVGCANISFFIYIPSETDDDGTTNTDGGTTNPPPQTTDPLGANYQNPINVNGLLGDSWTKGAMTNWVFLLIMLFSLFTLILILAVVIIIMKKKKQQ